MATYRPVKVSIAVILEDGSPDENIRDSRLLRDTLCESLSRTNGAEGTTRIGDSLARRGRRGLIADGVENKLEVAAGGFLDLGDDFLVVVVENVVGTERPGLMVMSRAAGRHDCEAAVFGDLDGKLSNAGYGIISMTAHQVGEYFGKGTSKRLDVQLPPQMSTASLEFLETDKHPLEKRANRAVHAASGTVVL